MYNINQINYQKVLKISSLNFTFERKRKKSFQLKSSDPTVCGIKKNN